MAIGQESESRGIGSFMQRSQRQWEQQRMIDAQEEMRRQREMQAEESKKRESDGGGQDSKKDSRPASQRGTNTPSSSIASIGSNAVTLPAAARAGAGMGGATPVSFGSNSMTMYNALTDLGVKPEVAAGAVGSMMGESGRHLNPAAYNPNDLGKPSGGALQWRGDRLSGLYNFAGTSDIRQIPIETQAKWMQRELQGSENGALQSLLKGNTVADGARAWTRNFERPHDPTGETARRTPMGEQFWASIQNGSVPSTTPGSRNRDAGNTQSPVKVAANTTTMNDASPSTGAGATTPGGATTPSATPAAAATPTTTGAAPNPGVPLPPRRPDDLGGDVPLPPRRPEMGPPMPEQSTQPATTTQTTQPQQQEDGLSGFFKDIGSFFSGEPIKDKSGREWDALYGFEKPPGEIAASFQQSNDAAKASDAPSMLDRSSAATATTGDSKSIMSDAPDIGAAFTPALNFFSSLFG